MGAGSKPLRPWQVCAGDVIGSGKRVEYVFERYGELYINASDEELVRQGKRTYGEELTRLYDLDLSGWRVIGHYGCGRGYEGRSWYDMGKPCGRRFGALQNARAAARRRKGPFRSLLRRLARAV